MDFKPAQGGIAELTHQTVKHLNELGEKITVLTPSLSGAVEFDKSCGYSVLRYGISSWTRSKMKMRLNGVILMKELFSAVCHVRPSYLVCTVWDPIAAANLILVSRLMKIPFFLFAHGMDLAQPTRLDILRRKTFRAAARVICISAYTRSLVENIGVQHANIAVIHGGIDRREIDSYRKLRKPGKYPRLDAIFPPGNQTILTISRLVQRKGIDRVIEAMPDIVSSVPEARFLIGGDGPDRNRLKQLAAASSAREAISFLGSLTEEGKFECYHRCCIFAMPSRRIGTGDVEGFGIVFLEANAFGKPVIGGRSGGVPDAVIHGVTGLLVDPNNTGEISEAIIRLLQDPDEARRLGENGRQRVENEFDWKVSANIIRSVIHDAIKELK